MRVGAPAADGNAPAAAPDAEAGPAAAVTAALVAGLIAGYAIAIPVGAVATLLVSVTARRGFRVGVGAALGVATVDGGYALAATTGGIALARAVESVSEPLRWTAAAVLAAVAARSAITAVREWRAGKLMTRPSVSAARTGMTPLRAYGAFAAVTALNPATVVYFAALVMGNHAQVAASTPRAAVFVVAAFAASASWQLLLAAGGTLLGTTLTGPRGRATTALVSGVLITAFAAHIALT